jgi:hypothetical protein
MRYVLTGDEWGAEESYRLGLTQAAEALGAFQSAEIKKWWPIIKAANIKGQ